MVEWSSHITLCTTHLTPNYTHHHTSHRSSHIAHHEPRTSLFTRCYFKPHASNLRPQTSDLRPRTSDLAPQTSDLITQNPTPRTINADLTLQTSQLSPHKIHCEIVSLQDDSHLTLHTSQLTSHHSHLRHGPHTSLLLLRNAAVIVFLAAVLIF